MTYRTREHLEHGLSRPNALKEKRGRWGEGDEQGTERSKIHATRPTMVRPSLHGREGGDFAPRQMDLPPYGGEGVREGALARESG